MRFWKELASGTPQRGVFKRLRRDGSPVWLEATYFPVKNAEGAVVEVLKIAADVTRNHSELLLLNAINDAIRQSMAVIEFTPDGEILDANENFLRLFGYSLKSLKGQHHRMLCFDEFYRENPDFWLGCGTANSPAGISSAAAPPASGYISKPPTTRSRTVRGG